MLTAYPRRNGRQAKDYARSCETSELEIDSRVIAVGFKAVARDWGRLGRVTWNRMAGKSSKS